MTNSMKATFPLELDSTETRSMLNVTQESTNLQVSNS